MTASLGLTIGVIAFCLSIAALFMLSLGECASKPMPTIDEDLGADGGVGGHQQVNPSLCAAGNPNNEVLSSGDTATNGAQIVRAGIKPGPSAPTFNPMNRFPAGRWNIPPGKLTKILK